MTRAARVFGWSVVALLVLGAAAMPAGSALARQSMSFVPGDRAHVRIAATSRREGHRSRSVARAGSRSGVRMTRRGAATDEDEGPAAKAVPGGGFTMQDGVLTYPAPARFQPQNLKRHP